MRDLLTIFLLGIVTMTFGQKVNNDINFPFQVIYAENVLTSEGQEIKELDLISTDDVLVVGIGGFLSMVHFFGFPVEIAKDSTVTIRDLDFIFDKSKGRKKRKIYSYNGRPNIDYLFISDARLGRKDKLSATGACHDCNFDMEIIYPPKMLSKDIFYQTDLCIVWQNTGASAYEIELQNIYGDSLRTFTSSANSLTITASALNDLRKDEEVLLLKTRDMTTQKTSDLSIIREFSNQNIEFPFTCSLTKSTSALMTGLHLEMSPRNYINEAEKYFKLAAELSDKVFYKTMLENFIKRQKR